MAVKLGEDTHFRSHGIRAVLLQTTIEQSDGRLEEGVEEKKEKEREGGDIDIDEDRDREGCKIKKEIQENKII